MKKKEIAVYTAATGSMVIVMPGRFACGFFLSLEICIIMALGTLFRKAVKKINLEQLSFTAMLTFVVFLTILIRQVFVLICAELVLQTGFIIYLPVMSAFTTAFLLDESDLNLKEQLKNNMQAALSFSIYTLTFNLLRDILGYGAISFISLNGIYEKILFNPDKISFFTFTATIPGAFVLTALMLSGYLVLEKKLILEKQDGEENTLLYQKDKLTKEIKNFFLSIFNKKQFQQNEEDRQIYQNEGEEQ